MTPRLILLLVLSTALSCGSGEEAHEISQRLANENHALRQQLSALQVENTHLHNLFLGGARWEQAARLRLVGGSGGSYDYLRQCPRGQALAGFIGRAGALIDALAPLCTPIDQHAIAQAPNGASPIETALPFAGGPSGNGFERRCEAREHVVGIKGRAGDLINNLQAICQPSDWAWDEDDEPTTPPTEDDDTEDEDTDTEEAPAEDAQDDDDATPKPGAPTRRVTPKRTPPPREHTLIGIGGGGGQAFERRCPKGWLAVGISGRNGHFVDSISLHCAPIDPKE